MFLMSFREIENFDLSVPDIKRFLGTPQCSSESILKVSCGWNAVGSAIAGDIV